MDERVELELRGGKPEEATELNVDNCKSTGAVSGITDAFLELDTLSMINVQLTTLKNFPKLPNLAVLEMSDNRLVGGLEHLAGCPNIVKLNMSGNLFKDVDSISPLKELANLVHLDLFSCPITQTETYRDDVFAAVPQITYLDGYDREDKEADDESDVEGLDEDEVEGEDDSEGESGEEDDEPGLEYLNSSKVNDEDETEDFDPVDGEDEDVDDDDELDETAETTLDPDASSNSAVEVNGTRKRKHEQDEGHEAEDDD